MNDRMPPQADGLYDPRYEHDACGVAMVARLDNVPGHDVVVKALEALDNLEHRGAEGADIRTGDGAGILVQLPHAFFRAAVDFELPPPGRYGVAMCFLPEDTLHRRKIEELLEVNVRIEGQRVLGWRDVPADPDHIAWGQVEQYRWRRVSFWDDGSVMKEEEYVAGLEHGYSRHFSYEGELIHEGEFREGEPYNGICHIPDFDRHPHYTMVGEYLEGQIIRELPWESCLAAEAQDETLH